MLKKDFKDEKDLFIEQKMKEDVYVSQKFDETFEKIMKGDLKMENQNNSIPEKSPKGKSGFFKFVATIATCLALFGGANIYANTMGYDNIFFMIKELTTKPESKQVNVKEEILSDRDITISYTNIEIAKGLKVQINNLVIQNDTAKLFIRVDQSQTQGTYITKFLVKDTTNNKNVQVGLNTESVNEGISSYTECILLTGVSENLNKLEVELYDQNNKKISTIKIDLSSKEIIVESEEAAAAFEKLPESELKEILGLFAHFYKEYEYDSLQDKVFEMAVKLVLSRGEKTTRENINNAMEELAGLQLDSTNAYGNRAGSIIFDTENEKYVYQMYEVDSPLVLNISELIFNNGEYTAKIIYCLPKASDYENGTIEQLDRYAMTLKFKLNEEYEFSKYHLTNMEDLRRELIENYETTYIQDDSEIDNSLTQSEIDSLIQGDWVASSVLSVNGEELGLTYAFGTGIKYGNRFTFNNGSYENAIGITGEGNDSGKYSINGNVITLVDRMGRIRTMTYKKETDTLQEKPENNTYYTIYYSRRATFVQDNEEIGEEQHEQVIVDEPANPFNVSADQISWKETIIDGIKLKHPDNWAFTVFSDVEYDSMNHEFIEGLTPNVAISGNVIGTDNNSEINMNIWSYEGFFVKGNTKEEAYKNIPAAYFALALPSDTYTTSNGQEWDIIRRNGDAHEYYTYLAPFNDGYVVYTISTGYPEDANALKVKEEILSSLEPVGIRYLNANIDFIDQEWTKCEVENVGFSVPSNWDTVYETVDIGSLNKNFFSSGTVKGLNSYRNKIANTYIEFETFGEESYFGFGENAEDTVEKMLAKNLGLISTGTSLTVPVKDQCLNMYKTEDDSRVTWYLYTYKSYNIAEDGSPTYVVTAFRVFNSDEENNTANVTINHLLNTVYINEK